MAWHDLTTQQIKETEFYKLSPSLLYILSTATTKKTTTTTNSKQMNPESECSVNQPKASIDEKKNPLDFFQRMFGSYGNSEEETEESLKKMLMKINQTIGEQLNSNEKVLYKIAVICRQLNHYHAQI